jgi:hypothetical protein
MERGKNRLLLAVSTFAHEQYGPAFLADVIQRNLGLGKAAALMECNLEAYGHPSVGQSKPRLFLSYSKTNLGYLTVREGSLFLGRVASDPNFFTRVRLRRIAATNGLSDQNGKDFYIAESGVKAHQPPRVLSLGSPPVDKPDDMRVFEVRRTIDVVLFEKELEMAPSTEVSLQGEGRITVSHFEMLLGPDGPSFRPTWEAGLTELSAFAGC